VDCTPNVMLKGQSVMEPEVPCLQSQARTPVPNCVEDSFNLHPHRTTPIEYPRQY